ncbi:isocitrate lyase/phosphoenolpyruvate mutase family protein [Bradyrhizobium sp. RDT10]
MTLIHVETSSPLGSETSGCFDAIERLAVWQVSSPGACAAHPSSPRLPRPATPNDAPKVWRTVRSFEKAGISGIHIEDHEFGKHTSLPPVIAPLEKALAKLKAAIEGRMDPNFLIIARTDVFHLANDVEEGVRRLNAFAQAGADLVMPAGVDTALLSQIRAASKGRW